MIDKYDRAYLKMARAMAETSTAQRLKVGCIIVKDRCIISEGVNGTPAGWFTNCCETHGVTDEYVVHAEMNALAKAARHAGGMAGSTVYCTHSACTNCAKHLISSGVSKFVYLEDYRDLTGLDWLKKANVEVVKVDLV